MVATLAAAVSVTAAAGLAVAAQGAETGASATGLRSAGAALVAAAHPAARQAAQRAAQQAATAVTERPEWVRAGVATVWVKPNRTRPVDRLALTRRPHIGAWINAQTLAQRLDLGPRVMTQTWHGDKVYLLRTRDRWSKVRLPDQTGSKFPTGIIGWIPTRQLSTTRLWPARIHVPARPTGADVLQTARGYLGVRYLWAGLSRHGIDCSGLTYLVYRQYGITLPRDAADQSRHGRPVSRAHLHRGDLIFFGPGSRSTIHHVGIYAGHGLLLHAPYTGTRVQLTPLRDWTDYWGARRLI